METTPWLRQVRPSAANVVLAAVALAGASLAAGEAAAQSATDARKSFVGSLTVKGVKEHLVALQLIADERGGNRAAGSTGYRESTRYVAQQLRRWGYRVEIQPFSYVLYTTLADPTLTVPNGPVYAFPDDIGLLEYAADGAATGTIVATTDLVIPATPEPSSTSGCEAADFPAATSGNIALIQRGTCTFEQKVENAAAAGAVGAIIFNEGNPGRTDSFAGTLNSESDIPAIAVSYAVGLALLDAGGTASIEVQAEFTPGESTNVIADTRLGDKSTTVIVGAHLDSVPEGPGINDNGSGTAVILEIARQLQIQGVRPKNRVRFAFWGAEESGLVGSTDYVENLPEEQLEQIALNLNFDMLGSPNFVRFVYDGDGDLGTVGPAGSAQIEEVFLNYFKSEALATEPTAFDGRSDYFAFIGAGIPAGGLFSGAEGIKTKQQVKGSGGTADRPYDRCYHQACDTIRNINETGLLQLGRGAADSVYFWATREGFFPARRGVASAARIVDGFDYRGPRLVR